MGTSVWIFTPRSIPAIPNDNPIFCRQIWLSPSTTERSVGLLCKSCIWQQRRQGFKLAFVLGSTSEFQALQPVLYISCHWEVCMGSPRLPSGLMICLKDSQNSEKLLYSQVQFLRAKGYCKGNQQRKKVYRMEFRRNQVWASSHPHPMELHGYHSIPPAVMHDNTHEVLPAWALVSRVWGVSHIGIECPCNWP